MVASCKNIARLLTITTFMLPVRAHSQQIVPFDYGDMEQWVVREIKESGIIGGNIKQLYELGPTDTIIGDGAYTNRGGSPWGNSNVLAKVAGITKTSTSVFPEERGEGKCARLETRLEHVRALGVINIEVIAAGSVFLGKMHEPVRGTKNPQSTLDSGIAFNKRPKALRFDYKTRIISEDHRIRSTGFGRKTEEEGQDEASVIFLLQKRWEDEEGRIFAERVGTIIQRYAVTTDGWVNEATYPILYGDISSHPEYEDYMRIHEEERYTINSRGKNVPILETGWAEANEEPTHLVLEFASSYGGAYIGSPGNTFWIDNIALIY